jgi:hypothetical protein
MEKERNIKKNDRKKLDGRWIEHSACKKLGKWQKRQSKRKTWQIVYIDS